MRVTIHCQHYQALSDHESCAAGVDYAKFKGQPISQWPCFCKVKDGTCLVRPGCELAKFPTPEELAKEEAEIAARYANISKARKAIVNELGGPWKKGTPGASGSIACPVCIAGTLRFSRAGYNGHIHAACITDGCVAWME